MANERLWRDCQFHTFSLMHEVTYKSGDRTCESDNRGCGENETVVEWWKDDVNIVCP